MTFTFTKEIVNNHLVKGYGYFDKCKIYKVFNNQVPAGQFFQVNEICFFNYDDKFVRIQTQCINIFKTRYILVDEQSKTTLGEYSIPAWTWQYGKIILNNGIYRCNKLSPDIRPSLFNKKTWGQYKIQISDGVSTVIYTFRMNLPSFSFYAAQLRPFSGEIELWNDNKLLLFAGFFLIENMLNTEDSAG